MLIFAAVIFFLTLLSIIGLFALKYWEERNVRVLYPEFRDRADVFALGLKDRLILARYQLAQLPPTAMHLARLSLHIAALKVAEFARYLEAQAQRLADFVSHKHRFELRETQSEFLKRMRGYALRTEKKNVGLKNGRSKNSPRGGSTPANTDSQRRPDGL